MADVPSNFTTDTEFEGIFTSGPFPISASYSGMLETWGDQDWIEATLAAGVAYSFRINDFTPTGLGEETRVTLITSAGQAIVTATSGSGFGYTPPAGATGRYFLVVSSEYGEPSEYSVSVNTGLAARYGDAGDNVIADGSVTIFGGLGNDRLTLTAGAGQLFGDAGNDTLVGSNVDLGANTLADRLFGGPGADSLSGGIGADQLVGGDGNDILAGGNGNDRMNGGLGNDTLNGGAGLDMMAGEAGDDIYVVDVATDVVSEFGGSGNDLVVASVSFSIANSTRVYGAVERLALTGTAIVGTGNAFANVITGNNFGNTLSGDAGNDALNAGIGNDRLFGGAGIDSLTGGANNDIFVFNTALNAATNRDIVTDFYAPQDTFQLENAIFTRLGAGVHALNPAFFRAGAAALDANDYIVYNRATGVLSYDGNGSAAGGSVAFAALINRPVLTYNDFVVI